MAASVIQTKTGASGASVASFSLTFTNPVNPGNCLVAAVCSGTGSRSFTLSDTVNGSWPGALSGLLSGSVWLFALPSTASGTPQVTATISSNAGISMAILEVNSCLGTIDQSTTHAAAGQTSSTTGPTASQTQAGDLAVCIVQLAVSSAGWAAGGGYTLMTPTTSGFGASYFIVPDTSAQTATFSWTTSTNYQSIIGTLNPGSANASVDTLLGQGWV